MSTFEIHTLNARDNFLLSFVHELSDGDSHLVNRTIVGAASRLKSALGEAGIDYAQLGPALTPRGKRHEIALIFEIAAIDSWNYGYEVHNRILGLLGRRESHSVLTGDLTGDQRRLAYLLKLHMSGVREYEMAEVGTQLYCVYITNCAESAMSRYSDALRNYRPFIGACDLTFSSEFRSYLSLCVFPRYVQMGTQTIQAKGDEEPLLSNVNSTGYDFRRFGFSVFAVQSTYFDLLLSYKIERPPAAFDGPDQFFTLNAVSSDPVDLRECAIEIDDSKYQYLLEAKDGSLASLGLRGYPKSKLESAIRAKIHSTYLYRLRFNDEFSFSGFTVLLELDAIGADQPVRVAAGFEFDEKRRTIRLVTLF